MISNLFASLLFAKKPPTPTEPWRLQTLNWQVEEYQLDWELAAAPAQPEETVWHSVRDTAKLLDQSVQAERLPVFCFDGQQFSHYDFIAFEMFVDYNLVFILTNNAQALFTPLAQQYRKLGTGSIHDNRANHMLWQHNLLLPEAIIQYKRDLMIISHDADSIFLIDQDE